jgi:hypothetical protein
MRPSYGQGIGRHVATLSGPDTGSAAATERPARSARRAGTFQVLYGDTADAGQLAALAGTW